VADDCRHDFPDRLLLFSVDGEEDIHEGADMQEFTEFALLIGCINAGLCQPPQSCLCADSVMMDKNCVQ